MIRRTHTRRPARRRAFTIVELMVVTVVVLILMSILVAASSIATDTVRAAKAQGDHMAQERAALAILRRDLQYDHFFEEDGKPNLGRRLSDQRTNDLVANGGKLTNYKPPLSGYFFASSIPVDNVSNFYEGVDGEGFQSSRSGNHVLQFTIIVPGGAPENRLTADVPFQNPLNSPSYPIIGTCAEVAYFLVGNGTTPGGVNKYKLIRRQRLAARNVDDAPAYSNLLNTSGANANDPPEVMAVTGAAPNFKMLNMNELTLATNRIARTTIPTYRIGEDILLHNVTSFEVKFTGPQVLGVGWGIRDNNGALVSIDTSSPNDRWPRLFTTNTDYPYDNLPYDGNYDTFHQNANWDLEANLATTANVASASAPLKRIRITGAMIRLRCWSPATKSSRQTTMQVDL